MAEKYCWRLVTVSRKGDTVWDGSFAANFARRHRSFRMSHAGPNGDPPFRSHGSPVRTLAYPQKAVPSPSLYSGPLRRKFTALPSGVWRSPALARVISCQCILGSTGLDGSSSHAACTTRHEPRSSQSGNFNIQLSQSFHSAGSDNAIWSSVA